MPIPSVASTVQVPEPLPQTSGRWKRAADGDLTPRDAATALRAALHGWADLSAPGVDDALDEYTYS